MFIEIGTKNLPLPGEEEPGTMEIEALVDASVVVLFPVTVNPSSLIAVPLNAIEVEMPLSVRVSRTKIKTITKTTVKKTFFCKLLSHQLSLYLMLAVYQKGYPVLIVPLVGSFSTGPNVVPLSLLPLKTGTEVPFLLVSHHVV